MLKYLLNFKNLDIHLLSASIANVITYGSVRNAKIEQIICSL